MGNTSNNKVFNQLILAGSLLLISFIIFGDRIDDISDWMSNQLSEYRSEPTKEDPNSESKTIEEQPVETNVEKKETEIKKSPEPPVKKLKPRAPRKTKVPTAKLVKSTEDKFEHYSPQMEEFSNVDPLVLREEKYKATEEVFLGLASESVDENVTRYKTLWERLIQIKNTNNYTIAKSKSSISVGIKKMDQYDEMISVIANKYRVDPLHLKTLCAIESSFNAKAMNPNSSATGLTQIIVGTYESLVPKDAHLSVAQKRKKLQNPYLNLEVAAMYLKKRIYPKHHTDKQVFFSWYLGDKALELLVSNPKALNSTYMKAYHPKATEFVAKAIKTLSELREKSGYTSSIFDDVNDLVSVN